MALCLAIETSCDDTSVALVNDQGEVLACLSKGQDAAHSPFGGIVPEIASRNHTFQLLPLIEEVLRTTGRGPQDLTGIAVTNRPGLIGSLIVGVVTAKTLALTWKLPWIGINHLEGHILAPFLKDSEYQPDFDPSEPYLALAVSGGHSTLYLAERLHHYRILGQTLDDAAGEAFDKFGKMVGLGFPGGVQVDRLSKGGDPTKYHFPRGLIHEDTLNFSFSGLKSAAHRILSAMSEEEIARERPHLCASFQAAVVDALMAKLEMARKQTGLRRVVVSGGVSANSALREQVAEWAVKHGCQVLIPPLRYCTDNAAMIGLAGVLRLQRGESSPWDLGASPSSTGTDFIT